MRRPIYVWQPASLFQPESNDAAFTKYSTWDLLWVYQNRNQLFLNKDGWHQYSDSNFTSLTVAHFAHSYPMKTVCILLKWEFHRDAASNNPTLKSISPEKHLQPLMFLFYCTSNGMALRRCKAWCTAGLWIRQCEVRMTLYSDFKLTFKPVSTILKYFSMLKNKGGTTWGLFVKEINCTLL